MSDRNHTSSGISLTGCLLVVFVVLKLTGNVDWSWVWVLSPLWIPVVAVVAVFTAILPFWGIGAIVRHRRRQKAWWEAQARRTGVVK